MRLVTYVKDSKQRAGLVVGDSVVDLERASLDTSLLPEGVMPLSSSLKRLLEEGEEAMRQCAGIQTQLAGLPKEQRSPDLFTDLKETHLAPPIPNPQKIICVGMNYKDHCQEQHKPLPERPILFAKFPTTLVGNGDAIVKPALTEKMDYEAELAVVIGTKARGVSKEDALSYVAGYSIMNDVSARDIQFSDGQWVRGKSFDTFAPLGPYLVTSEEVGDPQSLGVRLTVNSELRQESNTANMVFSVAYLVSYISDVCTLLPGDVISTGTPGGVGVFRDPPVFLKGGDVVSIEIEKLGTLANPVVEGV